MNFLFDILTAFIGYVLVWGQMCEKNSLINPDNNHIKLVNNISNEFIIIIYSKHYNIYKNSKVKIINLINGFFINYNILLWYLKKIKLSMFSFVQKSYDVKNWIKVLIKSLKPKDAFTLNWIYMLIFSRRIFYLGASEKKKISTGCYNVKYIQVKVQFYLNIFLIKNIYLKSVSKNPVRKISTTVQNNSKNSYISYNNIETKIANIKCTNYNKGKFFNLTKDFLCDIDFLKHAYNKVIKSVDTKIVNKWAITDNWFFKYADLLKNAQNVYKPLTWNYESKIKNNLNSKSLIITSLKDKITQKAISLLLNLIYENADDGFLNCSHGFRFNKSMHTALWHIKYRWIGVPWYIKISVKKIFNLINRKVLINLLKKKISDKRLLDNIQKMFNAKIILSENFITKEIKSILQEDSLSSTLCNIYLHELDKYIINMIIPKYKKGLKPTLNTKYYTRLSLNAIEKNFSQDVQKKIYSSKIRQLAKEGIKSTINDNNFIRVRYIRYADDFLIGVRGSKEIALKIFKEVSTFLKSNLHLLLDSEKTKLIYTIGNKIEFLGMTIHNISSSQLPYKNSRFIENAKRVKNKIVAHKITYFNKISKNIQTNIINNLKYNILKTVNKKNLIVIKQLYVNLLRYFILNCKGFTIKNIIQEFCNSIITNLTKNCLIKKNKKKNDKLVYFSDIELLKVMFLWEMEKIKKTSSILIIRNIIVKFSFLGKWSQALLIFFKKSILLNSNLYEMNKNNNFNKMSFNILVQQIQQVYENFSLLTYSNENKLNLNTLKSIQNFKLITCPIINIDWIKLKKEWQNKGIINNKGNPGSLNNFKAVSNYHIVQYYNTLAYDYLFTFKCADDFNKLKNWINWFLRYSLISTLNKKLKLGSRKKVIEKFSIDIKVIDLKGNLITFLPREYIYSLKKEYLINKKMKKHF